MSLIKCLVFLGFLFSYSCSSSENENEMNSVYYKNFDIFSLEGEDPIKSIDKNGSVEIKYNGQKPAFIKYYMPKRAVTLILEDSILEGHKPIYIYSTSNFNGGQPGKRRVYTSHYEEYKHLVYVSLSDTLLVETKDVPETPNFLFDLYIRQQDKKIIKTSKGEYDYDNVNAKLSRQQLYTKWIALLQEKLADDSTARIIIKKLPPE